MSSQRQGKPQVSFTGLLAFEAVARLTNFARAAAELEVTPTAMSKTVKKLEAQLGVRLFNRTTRSVGLTEHGAQLLGSLAPALDLIRASIQEVGETASRPTGSLRINTSYVAFAALIQPHQAPFMDRFPNLRLEVATDDRFVDIVAGGFDAGIRLGHAVQRDMVAVPLGPVQRMTVVAAPSYLAKYNAPRTPKDLFDHDCIRLRFASHGRFFEWAFQSRGKRAVIDVQGRLIYSEMRSVADAARQGLGLAYVFRQFVEEHIRRGQLVPLLEKHCAPSECFYLYYPHRVQMPGKLRAFIDFMHASIQNRAHQQLIVLARPSAGNVGSRSDC